MDQLASPELNKQGLYDIYGGWHVPFWQTKNFYSAMVVLVVLLAGFGLWLLIRWYRLRKSIKPYWQVALADLDQLKQKNIATVAHGKEFYGHLTVILKKYLYRRYGVDGSAKTDAEFLTTMTQLNIVPDIMEELRSIAAGGTIIKFANEQAVQDQIEQDFRRAVSLIKRTIPQSK